VGGRARKLIRSKRGWRGQELNKAFPLLKSDCKEKVKEREREERRLIKETQHVAPYIKDLGPGYKCFGDARIVIQAFKEGRLETVSHTVMKRLATGNYPKRKNGRRGCYVRYSN
jgi:hypothetical protein